MKTPIRSPSKIPIMAPSAAPSKAPRNASPTKKPSKAPTNYSSNPRNLERHQLQFQQMRRSYAISIKEGVECCVVSDCGLSFINFFCEANKCIRKGNPRFTLTWFGEGTYLAWLSFTSFDPCVEYWFEFEFDFFCSLIEYSTILDDAEMTWTFTL